jgi:hypothetical protein
MFWGRETALPCPAFTMIKSNRPIEHLGVGKRHCRVRIAMLSMIKCDRPMFWGRETALPCPVFTMVKSNRPIEHLG